MSYSASVSHGCRPEDSYIFPFPWHTIEDQSERVSLGGHEQLSFAQSTETQLILVHQDLKNVYMINVEDLKFRREYFIIHLESICDEIGVFHQFEDRVCVFCCQKGNVTERDNLQTTKFTADGENMKNGKLTPAGPQIFTGPIVQEAFQPCTTLVQLQVPKLGSFMHSAIKIKQWYRLTPLEIRDVDAPPLPALSFSPQRDKLLSLKRRSLPPLSELAKPEDKLAGIDIDGRWEIYYPYQDVSDEDPRVGICHSVLVVGLMI